MVEGKGMRFYSTQANYFYRCAEREPNGVRIVPGVLGRHITVVDFEENDCLVIFYNHHSVDVKVREVREDGHILGYTHLEG
jgi:hypothetical protein